MKTAVRIEQLRWCYRRWWRKRPPALDDVSFNVASGTLHALIGANGSGKTTLLRHLAGLLPLQDGNVEVLGDRPGAGPLQHRVSYLPETTAVPTRLKVGESLRLQGVLYGIAASELEDRCRSVLKEVGLAELYRRPLRATSKGQRRRVALAQALLPEPALLLLDEPFHGVDPIWCERLQAVLRRRVAAGTTILLSSHLLADVERLADAITLLALGKVVLSGPVPDVLREEGRWNVRLTGIRGTDGKELEQTLKRLLHAYPDLGVVVEPARKTLLSLIREQYVLSDSKEAESDAGSA